MTGPTGKIEPQPWLTAPQTRKVMKALDADGGEARFVGGCVRDALLKRPVEDIDIATTEPPEKIMTLLENAGVKAIPTGISHGTVTAVIGQAAFQITTLRVDEETDGRRAKVAFTDDWEADAARRDFTINTMSCTLDGDVYDPLSGMKDLAQRRVRFVGNARQRIEEDVLRMLRYFRMHAAYGAPPPDISALVACRALAPRLAELSGERVRDELLRILLGPDPASAVQLMRGERMLHYILPEAADVGVGELRQLIWLEGPAVKIDSVAPDALRRLAALLGARVDGGEAAAAAKRLVLSKKQTARLAAMVNPPFEIAPDMDEAGRARALSRMGEAAFLDAALLAWAAERTVSSRQTSKRVQNWVAL
ncbi:MAG TPA: CCA tRNA nucleotidyltransferase, partial [Rhodospirillales bacterium]|nr:CCA tRNA nucleotidyltransferase [Rhodospirillales bacterium]